MKQPERSTGEATSFPWISDHLEQFERYLNGEKRSPRTVELYAKVTKNFLTWMGKPYKELTYDDMQHWKQYLAEHYGENSMATLIAAVNQYTVHILRREDLFLRAPKRVVKSVVPLTEKEIETLLETAKTPISSKRGIPNHNDTHLRDYAMMCILSYVGLRSGAIGKLRISGLDLEKKKLLVYEEKGKDFSPRLLNTQTVQAIREYMEKERQQPVNQEHCDILFLTAQGIPMERRTVYDQVKRIALRAGITKNVYPHLFRHSMVTIMGEKGVSAMLIQKQSGHKSIAMVMRYTHLSEQSVRKAYDSVFEPEPDSSKTDDCPDETRQAPMSQPSGHTEDKRMKILSLYLDGKIPENMLDKLLSTKGEFATRPEMPECFDYI